MDKKKVFYQLSLEEYNEKLNSVCKHKETFKRGMSVICYNCGEEVDIEIIFEDPNLFVFSKCKIPTTSIFDFLDNETRERCKKIFNEVGKKGKKILFGCYYFAMNGNFDKKEAHKYFSVTKVQALNGIKEVLKLCSKSTLGI